MFNRVKKLLGIIWLFKLKIQVQLLKIQIYSYLFLGCEKSFDLGFLVDFSGDASSYFSPYIKNFIVETALQFDISANKSHFAYLPYSTTPALLLQNNWFSNPDVSNLLVGDITSQRAHLYSVVVPEPDPDKSVKKGKKYCFLINTLFLFSI